MTYRHHSLRCHHRVQNTQGSNEHQLRITCQECQGHLAIVYGRHLNVESRRLIREHLDTTSVPVLEAAQPPPVQRPQPRARAAAAMPDPPNEPEPAVRQEDVEAIIRECQKMTGELVALSRQATPPPPWARKPPEADPEEW